MSKIVFLCFRDNKQLNHFNKKIEILSKRLIPNNITPRPPLVINDGGIAIGIFSPSEFLPIKNASVCMGNLINPEDDWWKPGAKVPDGSYALFRSNENAVELVSDIVATRTVWYVKTDDMFIASTSQRSIVFFLQDFRLNKTVFPWMLSSGTLGPGLSWDQRIQCLKGDSRLFLDRSSWEITIEKENPCFDTLNISEEEHENLFKKALEDTFESLNLDYSKWVLPLSGGFDSRAILLMLKDRKNLKCITWGLKSSLSDKNSDTYIAKSLAKHFSLEHKFFETDISNEPIEIIFNRFLVAGEGRIDHLSGYMDGFKIWKSLFEAKFSGIIRGDEGFGWTPVSNESDVRWCVEVRLFSDYCNLESQDAFSLERQNWPKNLQRKQKESLATWRDRLYHEFRIPVVLAALNDLKCSYVEVINPFLSRKIIEQVRKIPDYLRTNKSLFKKIVYSMNPKIGFAKHSSTANTKDILKTKQVVNLISNEVNATYARKLLSDKFIDYILENIEVVDSNVSIKTRKNRRFLKSLIPKRLKNSIKTVIKQKMDCNILAFRAYIICKMNQIFLADATALSQD